MGFFDKLFNKKRQQPSVSLVAENTGSFSSWGGDAYADAVFKGGVDAIARHCGKTRGTHVVNYKDHREILSSCKLTRLLSERPNALMTAYSLWYKMASQMYCKGNAFAFLDKDAAGTVQAVYPVNYTTVELLTDATNTLYIKFGLTNGKTALFAYQDVLHLRRFYNTSEWWGDNNSALNPVLEASHALDEGIVNAVKSGAGFRGILSYDTVLPAEMARQERDAFVKDFMQMSNSSGLLVTDTKKTYTPIDSKPTLIPAEQAEAVKQKVYDFLGISSEIVTSSYDENVYGAFYEAVVEPFNVQLSQEATAKVFSERERVFGNQIVFNSGTMNFMSNSSKINMIERVVPYGILSINDCREILNLAPIEGGERRIQSLNFSSLDTVDQYQLNKTEDKTE